MSNTVFINLKCGPLPSLSKIVDVLREGNWKLSHNGMVGYLIDYRDDFDWIYEKGDSNLHIDAMEQAWSKGAVVGVSLWWMVSPNYAVTMAMRPSGELIFGIGEPRLQVANCESITDVSWYIANLLSPCINVIGVQSITNIEWSEAIG